MNMSVWPNFRLIGKRVVDVLFVFSLGVTAEAVEGISVQNWRFRSNGAF